MKMVMHTPQEQQYLNKSGPGLLLAALSALYIVVLWYLLLYRSETVRLKYFDVVATKHKFDIDENGINWETQLLKGRTT